ncbi:hypothetical protein QOZ80_2AG0125890 [Eleusine coracana subsp. coracana]|nr:hypothetical protein QOZ80_2AG0125890 [Eleusine coracana subsp. coracana]
MASAVAAPVSGGKRQAPGGSREDGNRMVVTPLGAGNEVGRSCVHVSYRGRAVLFDCGVHPAYSGVAALPYFDEIDPAAVDVLLVTHFHLDHAAALPYFLEKTAFKGRVFMTHATKAIYQLLLLDYVRAIDFHQTVDVNGIRFWCYAAGHVLGAAMFMVDIAGARVLYTGDYSREEDRHLPAAETPQLSPDVCIIESTYGVQQHQPRDVRERRFTEMVHSTVAQGGRVLIPAYALGRAQELLLILDEYWSNHPELHSIPIYYASSLAKRCMAVYQTHISSMNENIRNKFGGQSNPFYFKHIESLNSIDSFHDVGPSVVMASPGGLQSGLSRQLFDRWCSDRKNACVIPGYIVAGTLAKTIINEPREVTLANGLTAPLNMQVHYISFSAHADFPQTSAFLDELRPPNIVLVHGEATEMSRLKQRLVSQFDGTNTNVVSPKNCQPVELRFRSEKTAKVVGRLAAENKVPDVGESVSGLLLTKGFTYQIVDPEELRVYTRAQLSSANITQRVTVPYSGSFDVIRYRLEQIYECVEESESDVPALVVHQRVRVSLDSESHVVTLQWSSDPISDMVSDSVVAVILSVGRDKGPKHVRSEEAVRRTKEEAQRMAEKVVHAFMVSLFGDVKVAEEGRLVISVDGDVAHLDGRSGDVECENAMLRQRIETAFRRIQGVVRPIPLSAF